MYSSFVLRPLSFRRRGGFTLTELLIVIAIIAILSGLGLSAYSGATQMAREMRTRSQINKIDQLIMERYEGYRTRAVPFRVPVAVYSSVNGARLAAQMRLTALRELMRLEMPDRISDLCDSVELTNLGSGSNTLSAINSPNTGNNVLNSMPSLARSYKRRAAISMSGTGWSAANEGAECLYLILSTMRDGDKSALDFFQADEIGDVDEDGMKEILDGWGRPIEFLRWPAGYAEQPGPDGAWGAVGVDDDQNGTKDDINEAGWPGSDDIVPATPQTRNWFRAPDPFDPAKVDPRWGNAKLIWQPYALYPLIYSSGRDKIFDVSVGKVIYAATTPLNDPYFAFNAGPLPDVGLVSDTDGDGTIYSYVDNITNHDLKNQ